MYNASALFTAVMEFASVQMAFLHTNDGWMDGWIDGWMDWALHGNLLETTEQNTPYISHSQ